MMILARFSFLLVLILMASCQTTNKIEQVDPAEIHVSGPIEITTYNKENLEIETCTISGKLKHEYAGELVYAKIEILGKSIKTNSDTNGNFELEQIPEGDYTVQITEDNIDTCTIEFSLKKGESIYFEAILAQYSNVIDLKPIIYLYPEEKMEVHVELDYDGKLTTTYPIYPEKGWKLTAFPDGTLIDENNREYYALYWEGEPRAYQPIRDGFVVPRDETISFLEEKLALLGLNARESNEFIIYWLPILEKSAFNLIHFADEEYQERAKLNITPEPETLIRISMEFQGLDEELDIPKQDITPMMKPRKGFTVIEWGGQEMSKVPNL